MARRNYSNTAVNTTLVTGINGVVTTLDVGAATGWPIAPFLLVIDPDLGAEELILVGAKSGVTFSSLTRGFGGTSAVAHNASAVIKHVLAKEDHDLTWTHIHVPGTDDTQQLSHDNLSGVSANDHHSQIHAIIGGDHTGTIDHGSNVIGLGDDDHTQYLKEKASGGIAAEVPTHTHLDAANAGPVDHGSLQGLTDDDHPQYLTPAEAQTMFYPVGSLYFQTSVGTNPATLLGFGTWVAFGAGRMMIGLNAAETEFDTVLETGGTKTPHVHTMNTHIHGMSTHAHGISGTTSSNGSHDHGGNTGEANAVIGSGQAYTTGANEHVHPITNQAAHNHTFSDTSTAVDPGNTTATDPGNTNSGAHLNPYIVVYMWRRTA